MLFLNFYEEHYGAHDMTALIMVMAKMMTKIMLMTKMMMVMVAGAVGGDALKSAPIKAKGISSVLSFFIIIIIILIIILLSW